MPYPQTWPDESMMVTCAYCKQTVKTKVTLKAGKKTKNKACLFGCLTGCLCCIIPYCMKSTKDPTHKCTNCKKELGTNKKQGC